MTYSPRYIYAFPNKTFEIKLKAYKRREIAGLTVRDNPIGAKNVADRINVGLAAQNSATQAGLAP